MLRSSRTLPGEGVVLQPRRAACAPGAKRRAGPAPCPARRAALGQRQHVLAAARAAAGRGCANTLRRNQRSSRKRPSRISRSRSRLVAATTRAVLLLRALPPSRRKRPESRNVSSLACSAQRQLAHLVEEERAAVGHLDQPAPARCCASVKAPFSWPNSSLSTVVLGERRAVDVDEGRALARRRARARAGRAPPCPTPVSPSSSTGLRGEVAMRSSIASTWRIAADARRDQAAPAGQLGLAPAQAVAEVLLAHGPLGAHHQVRQLHRLGQVVAPRPRGWRPPRSRCRRARSPSPPACPAAGPSARAGSPARRRRAGGGPAPPARGRPRSSASRASCRERASVTGKPLALQRRRASDEKARSSSTRRMDLLMRESFQPELHREAAARRACARTPATRPVVPPPDAPWRGPGRCPWASW